MAAIEYRVLSEILRDRSLANAFQSGIKAEHFKDIEAKELFKYLERHWYHPDTRNEIPLMSDIMARFPSFRMTAVNVEDTGAMNTLARALRTRSLESDLRGTVEYLNELVDYEEPYEVLKMLKARMTEIDFMHECVKAFGVREIVSGVKEAYEGAINGSVWGIPWPWDCLTEDTMGKRVGDLIVIYGRMKSMKTWIMLFSAIVDYMLYNQRVMIWSREMTPDKLKLRIGSILAGVDYQLLKSGKLPPAIEERAFQVLDDLEDLITHPTKEIIGTKKATRDLIVLSGRDAPKTLDALDGMVEDHKPDILYVDSFYHLESGRASEKSQPWYKIQCLVEDLKQMAMDKNIPVVAITQANREGEKTLGSNLTEVAGSDAIGREADLIMRIIKKRSKEEYRPGYEAAPPQSKKPKEKRKFTLSLKLPKKSKVVDAIKEKATKIQEERTMTGVGAEVAILLPGNREGVLEGFKLHVIPGYHFNVTQASMDSASVKQWVGMEEKRVGKVKTGAPRKAQGEEPAVIPGVPKGFEGFNK